MSLRSNPERRKERLKRRELHPERFCSSPFMKRCLKSPVRWGMCGSHALEFMDKAWSQRMKGKGYCTLDRIHARHGLLKCKGNMNACHAINRDYKHTRWDPRNGAEACYGFNYWSERHPLEAEAVWREYMGDALYEELRKTAVEGARGLRGDLDWDHWRSVLGV